MHLNKTISRALQKHFLEYICKIFITGNIFYFHNCPLIHIPHHMSTAIKQERRNFDFLKNKYLKILKGNPEALL